MLRPAGGTLATRTTSFGVSRREGHDSSRFYERFPVLAVSDEDSVTPPYELPDDGCFVGDARRMDARVKPNSVALVVTSPPYFVGKDYEEELGKEGVPKSYVAYRRLLHRVFAKCFEKLEPGGRIAVNVANLGRKPYRSLSADVIGILEDLGYLLRGEVIWKKADGAAGNCAWGTFGSPSNPVLRDITERVVIASKGRFDRAKTRQQRKELGLPSDPWLLTNDEFMEATLDVWDMPPESARRVNHPAPFPVELPERLIRLYTYKDDLVLDPFMGSGSTLVAAARNWRRWAGYDNDRAYVDIARTRVLDEIARRGNPPRMDSSPTDVAPAGAAAMVVNATAAEEDFQARASREGKAAQAIAERVLTESGFRIVHRNHRLRGLGLVVNFIAEDQRGESWYFDVSGAFTTTRGGLLRTDTVWKSLGRAHVLNQKKIAPVVFLTSHLPRSRSEGDTALRAAGPRAFFDAIEMLSLEDQPRLARYAKGEGVTPLPGFWTERELADF
jgi:DNA modification methylase